MAEGPDLPSPMPSVAMPEEPAARRLRLAVLVAAEVTVLAAAGVVVIAPPHTGLDRDLVWLFLVPLLLNLVAAALMVFLELRPGVTSTLDAGPLSETRASESETSEKQPVVDSNRDGYVARRLSRARALLVAVVLLTAGLTVVALVVLRASEQVSDWPAGVPPQYIREGQYVDPDWPPVDGYVGDPGESRGGGGSESFGEGGGDVGGGAAGLPDVMPPLTRTADALAAQVAELAFNTLLGEGVATTADLRAWLLERGGSAVDTTVNEFLKGAMTQIWRSADKSVTEDDLEAGVNGVPALCDGVAVEMGRLLDQELGGAGPQGNRAKEDVALYLRQQLCPVLVLVTPADPGTAPTRPAVPSTLDGGSVVEREERRRDVLEGDVQIVRRGDSLWTIVERRYPGAPDAELSRRWHAVWFSNRRLIGPDPHVIEPGMRLRMP